MTAATYNAALRRTRRIWRRQRSADAIVDAVSEVYVRFLARARAAGREMDVAEAFWISKTASSVLRGDPVGRARGARSIAACGRRDVDGEVVDPASWIEEHLGGGGEDVVVALLDGQVPRLPPGLVEVAESAPATDVQAALREMVLRGWRTIDIAQAVGASSSAVSQWKAGTLRPNARDGRRLIALRDRDPIRATVPGAEWERTKPWRVPVTTEGLPAAAVEAALRCEVARG